MKIFLECKIKFQRLKITCIFSWTMSVFAVIVKIIVLGICFFKFCVLCITGKIKLLSKLNFHFKFQNKNSIYWENYNNKSKKKAGTSWHQMSATCATKKIFSFLIFCYGICEIPNQNIKETHLISIMWSSCKNIVTFFGENLVKKNLI